MVFVQIPKPAIFTPNIGLVITRQTGKYVSLLIFESLLGTLVAVSNIFIITVLVAGWRRLMKNEFYIVVVHLIFFTSLKAFVELGFIIPYYVMQSDGEYAVEFSLWSRLHIVTHLVLRVLLYYIRIYQKCFQVFIGVLFFSALIAVNRYLAVTNTSNISHSSKLKAIYSCLLVLGCSAAIPFLYFFCECQYKYDPELKMYRNVCKASNAINIFLNSLIYLFYGCSIAVLLFRKRRGSLHATTPIELKLLRQSIVVFLLYTASILSVFGISFILPNENAIIVFYVAYAENMLNLSIAAVYPICLMAMSGEMKSVLLAKIVPAVRSVRVASVSQPNSNNNNNNNAMPNISPI